MKVNSEGICSKCESRQILEAEEENSREKYRSANEQKIKENEKSIIEKERLAIEAEERLERQIKRQKEKTEMVIQEIENLTKYQINLNSEKIQNRKIGELSDLKYSNITAKGKYSDFVAIDVETTGLNVAQSKIIEIAAIKFENLIPTEIFSTFIDPGKPIPEEATRINGITNEMVTGSPNIKEGLPSFDEFVGKYDIVGHNLEFDLKFIHRNGSKIIDTNRKYFCTYLQSKKMLKRPKRKWNKEYEMWDEDDDSDYDVVNHKLGTVCDHFDIIIPHQHRAFADAYASGKLFVELIKEKQNS